MKMVCSACGKAVKRGELLKCVVCDGYYHYTCVNITPTIYKQKQNDLLRTWRCPSCTIVAHRHKSDSTPVGKQPYLTPPALGDTASSGDLEEALGGSPNADIIKSTCGSMPAMNEIMIQISLMLDTKLESIKSSIMKELKSEYNKTILTLKNDLSETTDFIHKDVKDISLSVQSIKTKIKELEEGQAELNSEIQKLKKGSNTEVIQLKNTISQLKMDLNDSDQLTLLNDVEITGVPDFEQESTIHIALTIAKKLGMEIGSQDIVSAVRVGPRGRSGDTSVSKPRPLIVKFTRRALRDDLIKSARVRRQTSTSDLGLQLHEHRKIYVNERLTKLNRELFWKARQAGREAGWRFVWTKDGHVLAKKTELGDSKTFKIRTDLDIARVFGSGRSIIDEK